MTAATLPRHRHRKPRLHKRLLARLRSRREAVRVLDAALEAEAGPVHGPETLAQAAQRERGFDPIHHAPPPLLAARLELAAVKGTLPAAAGPGRLPVWVPVPAAVTDAFGVPPAAVLPDEPDERWPHLAPAYDDDTHAFGLSITEAGQ